jgi:hypothetical protein
MRIFLLAIGGRERASSRLRVWDHVAALRGLGHEVTVDSVVAEGARANDFRFFARLLAAYPRWLGHFLRADAIVLQETMILWPALLLNGLGKRRRVVFDFSDPVDRVGKRGWVRAIRRALMRFVTDRADVVVVENGSYVPALAARGIDAHKFYGPVDVTRYNRAREDLGPVNKDRLRIGWTGSPGTFGFIAPILPHIDAIARTIPIELMLIGVPDADCRMQHATLTKLPWTEASEFELVPTFDLGLFRIDDGEDARWRGAGKLFIYLAASVPFIATDRGIAHDVMRESGLGFPVDDQPGSWLDGLRLAIESADTRFRFGAQSLDYARAHLSYERYREKLLGFLAPGQEGRSSQ